MKNGFKSILFIALSVLLLSSSSIHTSRIGGSTACEVYGDVKFVDYGEDYKVKRVDYGEDVKIKWVSSGANSKGRWTKVEYGAKYKLKWVDSGEDFKIKEVSYGEGCN